MKKNLWKYLFVILVVAVIFWVLKDDVPSMMKEVSQMSPWVILKIILCGVGFNVMEGIILTIMLRTGHPSFRFRHGIECSYYAAFYRVATVGSGSAVGTTYYLNKRGVDPGEGLSVATMQYVFQKTSIPILAGIGFAMNYSMMDSYFGEWKGSMLAGVLLTIVICTVLILFCASEKFHQLLLWILRKLDRKGKYAIKIRKLEDESSLLQQYTKTLFKSKKTVLVILLLEFIKLAFWYTIPYEILTTSALTRWECMSVMALALALAGVIPAPGGLGSTDGLIVLFFGSIVGNVQALSLVLLYRFATYLCPFIIGIIPIVRRKRNK